MGRDRSDRYLLGPLTATGGIVAYLMYRWIKTNILQFNDRADAALEALADERKKATVNHKRAFETLSELQQVAYTGALDRDVEAD